MTATVARLFPSDAPRLSFPVMSASQLPRETGDVGAALTEILLDTEAAGFGVIDTELRYVHVNRALATMNGRPAEDHPGRRIHDVLPPDAVEYLEPLLREILATGRPARDLSVTIAGGRQFSASYYPVRDAAGTITGIAAFVAERTSAEVALRGSEERFRRVAESGIVGLFFWTVDGGITEANDAFLAMLGYTQDDLGAGRVDWRRMTPPEYAAADEAAVRELLATGRHGHVLKEYVGKDGRRVPVIVTSALLDGSRERGVCVCIDDTARRAAEDAGRRLFEAEREARAEAEAANRAKGEFLAVMSHELRTPLNAIGGYAELIEMGLRGPVTEQQRADLARIQASQRHLLGLINQVLNYTRVETGTVRYDIADVPVGEALAAAEVLVLPQVRAKGLSYTLGASDPGLVVRADAEKLRQILLNLLGNAIKFTEPGGRLTVSCAADDRIVRIAVADTGIGIREDKLAHIFEPFVQVDQRLTRSYEGVGLGLAISRDLARGMGGDLTAESAVGVGSTFTLVLPRA